MNHLVLRFTMNLSDQIDKSLMTVSSVIQTLFVSNLLLVNIQISKVIKTSFKKI